MRHLLEFFQPKSKVPLHASVPQPITLEELMELITLKDDYPELIQQYLCENDPAGWFYFEKFLQQTLTEATHHDADARKILQTLATSHRHILAQHLLQAFDPDI